MSNPGTTNLVSWWELNETSGKRIDAHGSNILSDINTVGYTSGKHGNAASFTLANTESLSISDNPSISFNNVSFTVGGWFRLTDGDAANRKDLIRKGDEYAIMASNGVYWLIRDWSTYVYAPLPTLNTWAFFVAWNDYAAGTMYLQIDNGTPVSASSAGSDDGLASLTIGAGCGADADEVFIYRRALTSAERTWLYNSGAGRCYRDVAGVAGSGVAMTPVMRI